MAWPKILTAVGFIFSRATLTYKYHEGGKLERLGIVDHHAFAPGAITDPPQLIDLTGSCFTSSVDGRFRGLGVSSYLEADFRSLTLSWPKMHFKRVPVFNVQLASVRKVNGRHVLEEENISWSKIAASYRYIS